jgi:dihydroorotase
MKTKILKYLNDTLGLQVTLEDVLYVIHNPANMHGHARKEQRAEWILPHMKNQFWAQQLMPNESIPVGELSDGVTSLDKLLWYRDHIYEICGRDESFLPIFSFYLSKELSVNDIERAWKEKLIGNIKFYPQGGTTNSANGLRDFSEVQPQLELMNELKIPFSLHGETPTKDGKNCVHRDLREPVFYTEIMHNLMKWYTTGPIIAEHISTRKACDFVKEHVNVYATVTPQHALFTNDAIFHKMKVAGDWYETDIKMALYPSMVCMPVLKPVEDLQAIWQILVWQHENQLKKVFLGDDTAFHLPENKYTEGCACGVFNSPVSLEMYFMLFNYLHKRIPGFLDSFQAFASDTGLEVYGIQPKAIFKRVAIVRTPYKVHKEYHGAVPPFSGQTLPWKAIDVTEAFK